MLHATRILASLLLLCAACTFAAADDDKKVTKVVSKTSDPVPSVVTPPAPRASRNLEHVQVVLPRDKTQDEGATLTPEDIEHLRQRLRFHGFDIDERTGRPLFHAPVPPPGLAYYPYLPYAGGWIPYGLGVGVHGAIEDAYIAGREYERHDARRRFNHERALQAGVRLLEHGQYAEAIVALTLAGKLDNGDPACRIHLAQARMAQGHYAEAGQAIRRALQLQPKLVYLTLNLDSHYPKESTFDEHIDALAEASSKSRSADVYFLLGFMEFQRGDFDASHAAFDMANRIRPGDKTASSFLEIVRPSGR